MTDYRSARSRDLVPYVAGEQPRDANIIKLNTNENAYPPSPRVQEAALAAAGDLRLYPPTDGGAFREAAAQRHGVRVENIFCANSSDEVLALAFLAFFGKDKPICSPELTYSFYPVYAQLFEVPYAAVPMREGLAVDVDGLIAQDRAVALANPNAPTTIAISRDDVRRLAVALRARGHLLLLDEAYADFAKEDCVPLIDELDNLLITRTLSKGNALAGLRVGYAIGQPQLIEGMIAVKDSFNSYPLDRLAIAGGAAALRDTAYFEEKRDAIVRTRDWFSKRLRQCGFILPDSSANFVFARHDSLAGPKLFAQLRERNILVRHFNRPPIADYLRITIGTDGEMEAVARALEEIVAGG